MKIKNQIKLSFMSVPENVPLARLAAAAFAAQLEFTLEDLEEIKVVVSEAVSNSIIHGYDNDPNRIVTLLCTIYDEVLELIIEDEGKGIADVSKAIEPAFSTDPERMGLGFTFMQSFMDNLDVESTVNKGTRVIMSKKPPGSVAAASEIISEKN
ncbi:anti-sigma F factor [Phosphitispora fastidiosa]|uniref:anti-sigma F factor n=1 Tax=Phosphitispora fastidiosa TaxID=2837202 RepID=UPI001E55C360|nr:anti-sigma F factor [Phosphitispora fastidiosa]MBU7007709.1 stage II sporulation protein AB (anti-sigma F factor) [Phosphitispora fastidiosa]